MTSDSRPRDASDPAADDAAGSAADTAGELDTSRAHDDPPATRRSVAVGSAPSQATAQPADVHPAAAHSADTEHTDAEGVDNSENSADIEQQTRSELRGRPGDAPNRFLRALKEVAIIAVVALVISFIIKTFIAQAFWIPTGSMEQTLISGDRVVVSKITAGPLAIERGDIAVFQDPGGWLPQIEAPDHGPVLNPVVDVLEFVGLMPSSDGSHLIKRVIGVGGDHIVCCDDRGRISVNGEPLEETYLHPSDVPSEVEFEVTVPADHYWMMGDHRSNSRDSRHHDDGSGTGAVPGDQMVGRAMVLIWPVDRFDWFDGARDVFADVPESPPTGD